VADYADGVSQPRTSKGTHALPDAELVIEQLQRHVEGELRHAHITAMLPAWGQLLANDLVEVGQLPISGKCCERDSAVKDPSELQQCFVRAGPDCKEYKRSAPGFDAEACQKRRSNTQKNWERKSQDQMVSELRIRLSTYSRENVLKIK